MLSHSTHGSFMPMPLANYRVLNTRSMDAAREVVSGFYCDHELLAMNSGNRCGFHAVHNHARIDKLSVNFMTYSQRVKVNPGCLEEFFLLQLPLEGGADIETGSTRFTSDPTTASVISPSEETSMIWSEDCAKLLVQIQRSAVEQELSRLIQSDISKPLIFEPIMSLEKNPRVASWWRFVKCLINDVDGGTFESLGGVEKNAMEGMLITNLLHALPHNYTPLLEHPGSGIAPRQVKIAEAYMLENIRESVSITDLVEVTGVSSRSLFDAFRRFRGVAPMKRFSQLRLEQVRSDLQQATSDATVTDILTRSGITQMGRFAAQYRQSYGETPSETLRR